MSILNRVEPIFTVQPIRVISGKKLVELTSTVDGYFQVALNYSELKELSKLFSDMANEISQTNAD